MTRHPAACGECLEPVTWAWTALGKRLPLNPAPDPDGNAAAYRDGTGRWCARILRKNEQPLGYERRYMPHFATCPARRPPGAGAASAQVIDLDSHRSRRP